MADEVPAGSPATGTTKAEGAPSTRPDSPTGVNEGGNQTVSREEFQALQKQLNSSFNLLRGFEKKFESVLAAKPKEEQPDIAAQIAQQQAELRAFKEQAISEKREAAIQAAIASHGVGSDDADLLYDHIAVRHAKNIQVEGNTVFHLDPVTGEKAGMKDFVKGLLSSKFGERFKPAPGPGPSSTALRGGNNGKPTEERFFYELSVDEQDKLMRENPEKARDMVKAALKSGR